MTVIVLNEPCTKVFVHVAHTFEVLTLPTVVTTLVCSGWMPSVSSSYFSTVREQNPDSPELLDAAKEAESHEH